MRRVITKYNLTFPFVKDITGAVFEGSYRYDLYRVWDKEKPKILFVMLNPSTADEEKLDPTVTRCKKFAEKWGYGTLHVANLFAYKATNPKELQKTKDPVGPENDEWIKKLAEEADKIIVAWGADKMVSRREQQILVLLREQQSVYCLGVTKSGHPVHPMYVNGNKQPELYEGAKK